MKPVIAAALWAAIGSAACSTPPPAPPTADAQPVNVSLTRVQRSPVPVQFDAGGVVRARLTATIAGRVLAPVASVRVRPGDRVAAGDVLATLDARDLEAQSERASASVAAAGHGARAADAEKLSADARLTLATTSFERIKGLHAKRSATDQEFDEATAAIDAARTGVVAAEARAAEAASALTAAEAAARAASVSAGYAVVTAPFAGRIAERFVDPGAMAAPGAPLVTLEDTSRLRLEVSLDEARAGQLAVGQRAAILLDPAPAASWHEARISEIAQLDPTRHNFTVKIDVPSTVTTRPGAFGRARFATGNRDALTTSATAVIRRGQMTFVYTVDRDRIAHLRPVTVASAAGDRLEVLAGVSDGEDVVDQPPATLKDGSRVIPGVTP